MNNQEIMNEESILRNVWRYIYPLLAYMAMGYLVQYGFAVLYTIKITGGMELASMQLASPEIQKQLVEALMKNNNLLQGLAALFSLPILMTFYRWDRRRDARYGRIKKYEKIKPAKFVFAAFLGTAACFAGNNLLTLSGITQVSESYNQLNEVFYQGEVIIEILFLGILVPIVEELIFRVLIYRRLKETFPVKIAAVILAFMFAFFHGNIVQGIYAFFLSLLLVYVYERFHHALAPILFHTSANIFSIIVSEVGILDWSYTSRGLAWATTLVYCICVVIAVALIEYLVVSKEITE